MRLHFDDGRFTTNCRIRGEPGEPGRRRRARTRRMTALAVALVVAFYTAGLANAQSPQTVQAVSAAGAPLAYGLRPETSSVRFTIARPHGWRWRMRFVRMNGRLERGPDTREFGRVSVDIDARSVESNTPFAAAFVKSSAVLDTARYPSIRFESTGFIPTGEGKGTLLGLLTIRAVTHPIELEVTFDDSIVRSGARDRLAFRASGIFSRGAFGLAKWASSIDDAIPLQIEGEFARMSGP